MRDLLAQLAEKHCVKLVLRQPDDCRGLPAGAHTISRWLSIREGADAGERAFVRRRLRSLLWTDDHDGKTPLAELLPADANAAWPFSFRYFQDFDRQIVLPDGFTPERVNVEVRSRTRSIDSIAESFAWATSQG